MRGVKLETGEGTRRCCIVDGSVKLWKNTKELIKVSVTDHLTHTITHTHKQTNTRAPRGNPSAVLENLRAAVRSPPPAPPCFPLQPYAFNHKPPDRQGVTVGHRRMGGTHGSLLFVPVFGAVSRGPDPTGGTGGTASGKPDSCGTITRYKST